VPPLPTSRDERHYVFGSSGFRSPSVKIYFARRDISVFSGEILVKLGTDVRLVTERALLKRFSRSRGSKVEVIRVLVYECYNGGGMHLYGVASRLTCLTCKL